MAGRIDAGALAGARAAGQTKASAAGAQKGEHTDRLKEVAARAHTGTADAVRAPRADRAITAAASQAGAAALEESNPLPGDLQEVPRIAGRKKGGYSDDPTTVMVFAGLHTRDAHGADARRSNATPVTSSVLDSVAAEAGIEIDDAQLASPEAQEQLARIEERVGAHADDPQWLELLIMNAAHNLEPGASIEEILDTIESIARTLDGFVGRKKNG